MRNTDGGAKLVSEIGAWSQKNISAERGALKIGKIIEGRSYTLGILAGAMAWSSLSRKGVSDVLNQRWRADDEIWRNPTWEKQIEEKVADPKLSLSPTENSIDSTSSEKVP